MLGKITKKEASGSTVPFNGTHPNVNDIIHFDLIEHLPSNPKNYKSILVIIDKFTGWAEAVALQDTKSKTIARALLDVWISRNGLFNQCHSDRGPQFTSEILKIVFSMMNVYHSKTCTYSPKSDGQAEVMVKIVKNLLKAFCSKNPETWPDLLQQCMFAYRTSKHTSSNYSPYFLTRGHAPKIAMDLLFNTYSHKKYKYHGEYAYELYKTLRKTYSFVEKYLKTNRDFAKKQYDK